MVGSYEDAVRWIEDAVLPRTVSVFTSCTRQKLDRPALAEELYQGPQHVRLMRGVRAARRAGIGLWLHIVSARHGLIGSDEVVHPYDETFRGYGIRAIRRRADALDLPGQAQFLLDSERDLKVLCLGNEYLEACRFFFTPELPGRYIVFCSTAWARVLPQGIDQVFVVPLGNDDAARYHCGLIALKGELGGRLLTRLAAYAPAAEIAACPT